MAAIMKKNNGKMIDSAFAAQPALVESGQITAPAKKETKSVGRNLGTLILKPAMASLTILVLMAMQAINLSAYEAHVINVTARIKATGHLVINKVYYNVDGEHGSDPKNEWVELYNPTNQPVNLKKWEICNHDNCETINRNVAIPALGYALVSHDASTWKYWEVPAGVVKIHQLGGQYISLDNEADMLILKNKEGVIVDQMNWGTPDSSWPNYNSNLWNPGVPTVPNGHMLARVPSGFDADQSSDWKDLALPQVELLVPNGGEVWIIGETFTIKWIATNPNGPDSDLKIDLLYSADSGHTWAAFATSTPNIGEFEWRVSLFIDDYYVPSHNARIKVVARGPENFMVADSDTSDRDFCPPIDYSLLTGEELIKLKQWQDNGGKLASSTPEILDEETSLEPSDEDVIDEETINEEIVNDGTADFGATPDEAAGSDFANATTSLEIGPTDLIVSSSPATSTPLETGGAGGTPTASETDEEQASDNGTEIITTKIEITTGEEQLTIENISPFEENGGTADGAPVAEENPGLPEPAVVPKDNNSELALPPADNSSGNNGSDGSSVK